MDNEKLRQLETLANQLKSVEEEDRKCRYELYSKIHTLSLEEEKLKNKKEELLGINKVKGNLVEGRYTKPSDFASGFEKHLVKKLEIDVPSQVAMGGGCLKLFIGIFAIICLLFGFIPLVKSGFHTFNIILTFILAIPVLACGIKYYYQVNKDNPAIQSEWDQFYLEFNSKLASYKKSVETEIAEISNDINDYHKKHIEKIHSKNAEIEQKEETINSQIYGSILPVKKMATENGLINVRFSSFELYDLIALINNGDVETFEKASAIELERRKEREDREERIEAEKAAKRAEEARIEEQEKREAREKIEASERARKAESEAREEQHRLEDEIRRSNRREFRKKEDAKSRYASACNKLADAERDYARIAAHPESGNIQIAASQVARAKAEVEKTKAELW